MSLVSWATPWKPATIAIAPSSSASRSRPGVTSMIRAPPCADVVITPACEPVNERASYPRLWIAIASSAIEIRSPAVSSMSSSRPGGSGLTCWARSSSSSVVSPIAETTTTTSLPALRVRDDPLGDPLDPLGVGDRRAAVLLHDEPHESSSSGHGPARSRVHSTAATVYRQGDEIDASGTRSAVTR